MIVQLVNERNNNNNEKDKQIQELKIKHHVVKQDQFKQEEKIEELRREVLPNLNCRSKLGKLNTRLQSRITSSLNSK
jgi:hypothetical protein